MRTIVRSRILACILALTVLSAGVLGPAGSAGAQTIVDDWTNVTIPPPPAVKAAALDAKTTALLVLDFLRQNCSPRRFRSQAFMLRRSSGRASSWARRSPWRPAR